MISIVTAYYNRKQLFINTLRSIKQQNCKDLLEVIAVDDGSEEKERLEDLRREFPFLKVIRLEKENKWYHNSCIPFNIGFEAAKGDKIIIQNPECFHYGNILNFTEENLKPNSYLSFGCFSLDKTSTDTITEIFAKKNIEDVIAKNDHVAKNEGDAGWYNHSFHRPKAYHFCTAITRKDLQSLGGFDELYALGIAYDDDEFLSRITKKKLDIRFIDEELVLHQNHYSPNSNSFQNRDHKMHLIVRNTRLFAKLSKKSYYKANIISKFLGLQLKKFYIKIVLNIVERVS
jgi:GT2 family glycosyltransferase